MSPDFCPACFGITKVKELQNVYFRFCFVFFSLKSGGSLCCLLCIVLVIPPPVDISVIPLGDYQLKVDWTVAVDQSETLFVVEWFPIPNNTADGLYWKILNGSSRSLVITGSN